MNILKLPIKADWYFSISIKYLKRNTFPQFQRLMVKLKKY